MKRSMHPRYIFEKMKSAKSKEKMQQMDNVEIKYSLARATAHTERMTLAPQPGERVYFYLLNGFWLNGPGPHLRPSAPRGERDRK